MSFLFPHLPRLIGSLCEVVRSPSSISPLPFVSILHKALSITPKKLLFDVNFDSLQKMSDTVAQKVHTDSKTAGSITSYHPHDSLLSYIDLSILVLRLNSERKNLIDEMHDDIKEKGLINEEEKDEKKAVEETDRRDWWKMTEFRTSTISEIDYQESQNEQDETKKKEEEDTSSPKTEDLLNHQTLLSSFKSFSSLNSCLEQSLSLDSCGPTEMMDQLGMLDSLANHLLSVDEVTKNSLNPTLIPCQISCPIWYHHLSGSKFVESVHPMEEIEAGESNPKFDHISTFHSTSTFPVHAMSGSGSETGGLTIVFDSRCSLPPKTSLVISYTSFKKGEGQKEVEIKLSGMVDSNPKAKNKKKKKSKKQWKQLIKIPCESFRYQLTILEEEDEEEEKVEKKDEKEDEEEEEAEKKDVPTTTTETNDDEEEIKILKRMRRKVKKTEIRKKILKKRKRKREKFLSGGLDLFVIHITKQLLRLLSFQPH